MSSWSEERRLNNAADRAESRKDADAALDRRLKAEEAARQRRREENAAAEAEKRRKKRERKAAWKQRTDWVAVNTDLAAALAVMVAGMIPAFYFQLDALTGAGVFAGLAALLAFMLEAGAWAATAGEVKALKAGRAVWPYRIAIWTFTTAAASINFAHGLEKAWWLGAILAASSIVPVALFHMVMAGRHKAKPKDATAKARQRHEKKRRKDHPREARLADRLLSAAEYGTLSFEEAFNAAWSIVNGTAKLGMTPELHAAATRSQARLAQSLELPKTDGKAIRAALLERLTDPLPGRSPLLADGGESTPVSKRPKGRTTRFPSGKQASSNLADEKAREAALAERLPEVHTLADELAVKGRELSARQISKRIHIRLEDAAKLREMALAQRTPHRIPAVNGHQH
ncbi:hypothetical protein ACFUJR_14855 [Streptomyces sp. NPDC057271]|uniref:hypothetical protein n=1 Tax=unclassified Streptomyces TaxID=2593676 RepID=UPI00362AF45F